MSWCDIPDHCGERECVVTDSDDPVQYPLRNHLLAISLLGRDDDVSWNDDADGSLVNDHMDPESVREWKRS